MTPERASAVPSDYVPMVIDSYRYDTFEISILWTDDGTPVYACTCPSDTGTCEHREWFKRVEVPRIMGQL